MFSLIPTYCYNAQRCVSSIEKTSQLKGIFLILQWNINICVNAQTRGWWNIFWQNILINVRMKTDGGVNFLLWFLLLINCWLGNWNMKWSYLMSVLILTDTNKFRDNLVKWFWGFHNIDIFTERVLRELKPETNWLVGGRALTQNQREDL